MTEPTDAEIIALNASRGQAPTCQHRIVDARNPIIKSGYVCLNCGALFAAGDHDAAQAPSVLEDAARYRWLADYLIGDRTDIDDAIIACSSKQELSAVIDASMAANKGEAT